MMTLRNNGMRTTRKGGRPTALWPDERLGELRVLVGEGLSTAEIARRFGYTRACVIAKLWRLGIATQRKCRRCQLAAPAAKSGHYCAPCGAIVAKEKAATKNQQRNARRAGARAPSEPEAPKPAKPGRIASIFQRPANARRGGGPTRKPAAPPARTERRPTRAEFRRMLMQIAEEFAE